MKTGLYISGIGHSLLILWVLLGGFFTASRPEPVEVAQVSIVSGEEFAALSAPASAPRADVEAPVPTPNAPETAIDVPQPLSAPEPVPTPTPAPAPPAAPDTPPDVAAPPATPDTEVSDAPPTLPAPPSDDANATLLTESARPKPAPRVAPLPAAAPEPDAKVDDTVAKATVPGDTAAPAPPVEESTAPEEAVSEIVTEAEQSKETDSVLAASLRPRPRPARREKPAAPATGAAPSSVANAVQQALQEAQAAGSTSTSGTGTARLGPPLTQGEKDALRIGVQRCWVVDAGSAAGRTTVTVGMSMTEGGKVADGSLRLISSEGGDAAAAQSAFQAARRAILRCQKDGYDLPIEKYAQWRDIEMTFNPEKMRIK